MSMPRRERELARVAPVVLGVAILAVACSGAVVSESPAGPTPVKCRTTVNDVPATIGAPAAQVPARVVTTPECTWSATADAAWVRIDPPDGQGETALLVHVAENPVPATRTAVLQINDTRLDLTQAAAVLPEPEPPSDPSPAPAPAPPTPAPAPPAPPAPSPAPPAPAPAPPAPAPSPNPTPVPDPAPSPPAPAPAPPPTDRPSSAVNLRGRVTSLAGSCPALRFTLQGRSVRTDDRTRFTQGNCNHLRNGDEIAIDGELNSDGTVRAVRVELKGRLTELVTGPRASPLLSTTSGGPL